MDDQQGKEAGEAWEKRGTLGALTQSLSSLFRGAVPLVIPPAYGNVLARVATPGVPDARERASIKARAQQDSRERGVFTIYGHTHVAYIGASTANTGSWTSGKSDFLIIDESGVELKSWESRP